MLIDLSSSQESPTITRPKNNIKASPDTPLYHRPTTIEEDVCFPQPPQPHTAHDTDDEENRIDYAFLDQWVQDHQDNKAAFNPYYNTTLTKFSDARYDHLYDDYTNVSSSFSVVLVLIFFFVLYGVSTLGSNLTIIGYPSIVYLNRRRYMPRMWPIYPTPAPASLISYNKAAFG
jgi:hypothetical protein